MEKKITRLVFDLETTGLIGNLIERIICVGVHNLDTKETKCFSGKDENKILEDFFSYLISSDYPQLLGYNIDSFDLPFLIRRAIVYKKRIPQFSSIDLRKISNGFKFSYNRNERGRLRDWAAVFGMQINTENGNEMFKLYAENKFNEIENHCQEDILITCELFNRCKECGLIA